MPFRLSARRLTLLAFLAVAAVASGALAVHLLGGTEDAAKQRAFTPVVDSFAADKTQLDDCGASDFRCLEQAFGNIAWNEGAEAALARFEAEIARSEAVKGDCHRIAHTIGSASLSANEGDIGRTFAQGSAVCASGYYHGILERAFIGTGASAEALGETAGTMCESKSIQDDRFLLYQCVHGLGHGLMIYTGYDLPLSLETCEQLEDRWFQQSCDGGVFMENQSSSYGVRSKHLKDDDLIYPCNDVAERHKLYCYMMVTSRILPAVGYDFQKTAAECRKSEPRWIGMCFESFGRDASGNSIQEPVRTAQLCRYAGEYEGDCLYGAARDMVNSATDGVNAGQLCAMSKASLQERCFYAAGTIFQVLSSDNGQRTAMCRQTVGTRTAHMKSCMAGATAGEAQPAPA